jgi:formate hydrogenlyase subunit 4
MASNNVVFSHSNVTAEWICTRNDFLGNLAVLLAALEVFGTAAGLAGRGSGNGHGQFGIARAFTVIRQTGVELQGAKRHLALPAE